MKPLSATALKPYTSKELSILYGVSKPTFQKWLAPFEKAIGQRQGHFFNVVQVATIFEKLGPPSALEDA